MHNPQTYGLGESGLPGRPTRFLRFQGNFDYASLVRTSTLTGAVAISH